MAVPDQVDRTTKIADEFFFDNSHRLKSPASPGPYIEALDGILHYLRRAYRALSRPGFHKLLFIRSIFLSQTLVNFRKLILHHVDHGCTGYPSQSSESLSVYLPALRLLMYQKM